MIVGSEHKCQTCSAETDVFWAARHERWMCAACHQEYNPPYMTFVDFQTNNPKTSLWNLEVGEYEKFQNIEDIEWCGWLVRSKQTTCHSLVPRSEIIVYHLEFFGTMACGRCVDYKYFTNDMTKCMSVGCEHVSKPFRKKADINYPPVKSRYAEWLKIY